MYLKKGINPDVIKTLDLEQKKQLCEEIRRFLVRNVSKTGGHLSSNLGAVELTVALHTVFETPKDKIVWDVGHQCYAHKLLTGRLEQFHTLRQKDGISGFAKPTESEHDAFVSGHASVSIAAATGMAQAMKLQGDNHHAIAVIGDGSLTGGAAYEGLNNAGKNKTNLIVILNENGMSISKNTGALALYLAHIRSTGRYLTTKKNVKDLIDKLPLVGKQLDRSVSQTKRVLKSIIYKSNLFENFGLHYIGPIDGHNMADLIRALEVAKEKQIPALIHVYTKKGMGFAPAEDNPGEFHSISPIKTAAHKIEQSGEPVSGDTFSDIFGKSLSKLAAKDAKICAVTAAMKYGTGLHHFYHKYKHRFFDMGIAEQHCVTFASGLANANMLPVFAVYSTFLQRGYDQLIHDISICPVHVVFGVDRAGFVGEDGPTHQGIFDVAMFSSIPGMVVYSPSNYCELKNTLKKALYQEAGPVAVRYPRGKEFYSRVEQSTPDYRHKTVNSDVLVITYGRISAYLSDVQKETGVDTLQLIRIQPLDENIYPICAKYKHIFFFEEGIKRGGVAVNLSASLYETGYQGSFDITAVESFPEAASVEQQLEHYGLSKNAMIQKIKMKAQAGKLNLPVKSDII